MKKFFEGIRRLYKLVGRLFAGLQSPFLLAVRLYWGWQLSTNGWAKLHNLPRVTDFFASLNLPAPGPTAAFVSSVEFIGGILLGLGLLSLPTSIAILIDMTMAYLVADREAFTSFFSDPGKFYNADPYTFFFAALLILIFGPGKISLDHYISKYVLKEKEPAT
jgi:putative oxidoreductase